MKLTLLEIEQKFTSFNKDKLSSIKGGKGIKLSDDQLKSLFDYTGTGGFDSENSKFFNAQVRLMASTDAGASMIRTLANYSTSKINLQTTSFEGQVQGQYSMATNTLKVKDFSLINKDSQRNIAQAVGVISHELYHAFQDVFYDMMNDPAERTNISHEIDAYLFHSQVLKQIDTLNGGKTDYYHLSGYGEVEGTGGQTGGLNGGAAVEAAFIDIVKNSNLTLENYNTLISGFHNTMFNLGHNYDNLNHVTKTDLSQININQILFNTGEMLLKHVENGGTIIVPYEPVGPTFGVNWDDDAPFDDPHSWGFDPGIQNFDSWYAFNTSNYTGETMTSSEMIGWGGATNTTNYTWEYQNADGVIQFLNPSDPLSIIQDGFSFYQSQDPHNPGGYDSEGYDPNGCDSDGFGRDGRDGSGYDANGYDSDGYNRDGYDSDGYDPYGYDPDGYDPDGYDPWGYDQDGYDPDGYDQDGFDENGCTREENGDY